MGPDNANALGITDFGDAEMFALEHLLNGRNDDEIREMFALKTRTSITPSSMMLSANFPARSCSGRFLPTQPRDLREYRR
jgi:hypothetical protein